MRRVSLAAVFAAAAVLAMTVAAETAPAAYGNQYWSPGYCKMMLQRHGVELGDGRTFNVQRAFCIGRGGRECEWDADGRSRDYRSFLVIARSYDGIVRGWTLYVTGRESWNGSTTRLLGRVPSAYRFADVGQQMANELARAEHEKGCMPYRG